MYYKWIKIPAIWEIGNNIVNSLDTVLLKNNFSFKTKTLISSQELIDLFKDKIDLSIYSDIITIDSATTTEVENLKQKCEINNNLLVAFGGGSVLDVVKLVANKLDLSYVTIPSTLSTDAIYSPIARLVSKNGKKRSYGVNPPLGIIVDIDIIKNSPKELILSGVGDLVSNFSALKDWELAEKHNNETIDRFAYSLSESAAKSIMTFSKENIYDDHFISSLATGLIISGLSMVVANNSRPASGSEHLISHAIDEYYTDNSTLHGLQVAWGQLLVENKFRQRDSSYDYIFNYYENIGLIELMEEKIRFSDSETDDIIELASKIRNRYTVLDLMDRWKPRNKLAQ